MRSVSTRTAAIALGVAPKQLDNVLAREAKALLGRGSRGRERRIPFVALERVAIALILNRDLGVSVARGLELATRLHADPQSEEVPVGSLAAVRFDVSRLRRALESAVGEAIEEEAPARRGRVPREQNSPPRTPGVPHPASR